MGRIIDLDNFITMRRLHHEHDVEDYDTARTFDPDESSMRSACFLIHLLLLDLALLPCQLYAFRPAAPISIQYP